MSSSTANDTAAAGETRAALGTLGWPDARCIHMGDITELGAIVAGAFAHPDEAGYGEYLPLVGDFMSFNEITSRHDRRQGPTPLAKPAPGCPEGCRRSSPENRAG
jgi:hypothetical protein